MNHEEALTYALAGGPAPQGALDHLEGCPRCREELQALRGVESRLRAAAPASSRIAPRAAGLAPWPSDRAGRRVWTAAAAAVLALAFLATWWRPGAPAPAGQADWAPAVEAAYVWPGAEESTPAVLDAVQKNLDSASATPAVSAEAALVAIPDGEYP